MASAIAIKTILRRVIQPSSGITANRLSHAPFRSIDLFPQRTAGAESRSGEDGAGNVKRMACKGRIEGNSTIPDAETPTKRVALRLSSMISDQNDRQSCRDLNQSEVMADCATGFPARTHQGSLFGRVLVICAAGASIRAILTMSRRVWPCQRHFGNPLFRNLRRPGARLVARGHQGRKARDRSLLPAGTQGT